ncbi:MAG: hypothetical protein H7Z14_07865 [Anaerolineae bacterium]|nr:hypothetical protein [Phycisphaerae bacterium]
MASLAVASLDLQVVQLLRDAIRTADIAGGKFGGLPLCDRGPINAIALPRDRFEPTPHIEPRKTLHPAPRFEARPVFHERIDIDFSSSDTSGKTELAAVDRTPLPPPWRTPVWKMPLQPAPMVKVHIHRTDVHNKGSLIDLFL